jgi:outer membrane cobalamin receptor
MIDHIDILKDGASAVYGSDAITGVVSLCAQVPWLGDRRQLRNTNGSVNEMGEWEAWVGQHRR